MPKVVKPHFDNRVACGGCNSTLEFALDEVTHGRLDDDGDPTFVITCPTDNERVDVTGNLRGPARRQVEHRLRNTRGGIAEFDPHSIA